MSFDWNQVESQKTDHRWVRVTRSNPCPICGRPDWCKIRDDGKMVCCMRVDSGRRSDYAGYLFEHDGQPLDVPQSDEPEVNADLVYEQIKRDHDPEKFAELCEGIGLMPASVLKIGGRYSPFYKALVFPTWSIGGRVTGLRTRYKWGAKRTLKWSKAGLFAHCLFQYDPNRPLVVVEGPTDTAASYQLGLQTVGRPGCEGYLNMVYEFALLCNGQVFVVGDDDKAGRRGADRLAEMLVNDCHLDAVAKVAPEGDLRKWVQGGATPQDAEQWLYE